MENNLSFGKYIRNSRLRQKISQKELAAKIGLDFTYVSKIENGRMSTSESTIIKMAEVLGENPDELTLLANKIPSDFREIFQSSKEIPLIFRKISNLSPGKQKEALKIINKMESED